MKRQQKTTRAEIKALDEQGSFEAVIATLNVRDRDGDVILPGALDGQTVSILPAHNTGLPSMGKATLEERGQQVFAVGRFNLDQSQASEWWKAVKFDLDNPPAVQEWSWDYGFKQTPRIAQFTDGETARFFEPGNVDVGEVSPVHRGASVGSRTVAAKSMEVHKTETTDAPWDEGAEIVRIAKMNVERDPTGIEHHDGEGKASTRACYAGVCSLNSARFEDPNREAIYKHLAGHLADAEVEAPKLLDAPGVRLVDHVQLALWGVENVAKRLESVIETRAEKGGDLSESVKEAAIQMATSVSDLSAVVDRVGKLVDHVSPDDPVALALAEFQASQLRRILR